MECTKRVFNEMVCSERVKALIADYRNGVKTAKEKLPVICWQAHFTDRGRSKVNATPSGLVMVDLDHLGEALETAKQRVLADARQEGSPVRVVHITPSGDGLRVVLKATRSGVYAGCESIWDWQLAYARSVQLEGYLDPKCKDLGRASFCPCAEEVLLLDERLWEEEPEVTAFAECNHIESVAEISQKENGAPTGEVQTHFKGIALKDIALEYFNRTGGLPTPGERNQRCLEAALDLRHICDFHPEVIAAALPHFGLSETEVMRCCRNACKYENLNYEKNRGVVAAIVRDLPKQEEISPVGDEVQQSLIQKRRKEHLNDLNKRLMDALPQPLVHTMIAALPPAFRAAGVLVLQPMLGTLSTHLRAEYPGDNELHSPSMMTILMGEQASGKSFARTFNEVLMHHLINESNAIRAEEAEYEEKRKTSKNTKNPLPAKRFKVRHVGAVNSRSKVAKRMQNAEGEHVYSFTEELDNMTMSASRAHGNIFTIMRHAFENSLYEQDYVSEDSCSISVKAFFNFVALGTPDQVKKFINCSSAIQNGLLSRICIAEISRISGKEYHQPRFTAQEKQKISAWAQQLMAARGEVNLRFLHPVIEAWLAEQKRLAELEDNDARIVFSNRAASIGFRAVLAISPLYCTISKKATQKKLCKYFRLVADLVLEGQISLGGDAINSASGKQKHISRNYAELYVQMPEQFKNEELAVAASMRGINSSVGVILSRWRKDGLISSDNRTKMHRKMLWNEKKVGKCRKKETKKVA